MSGRPDLKVNTERDMSTEFSNPQAVPGLPNEQGLNKFTWNMRHRSGWNVNPRRSYMGNGPMVATGTYSAKLKVGHEVLETTFQVALRSTSDSSK